MIFAVLLIIVIVGFVYFMNRINLLEYKVDSLLSDKEKQMEAKPGMENLPSDPLASKTPQEPLSEKAQRLSQEAGSQSAPLVSPKSTETLKGSGEEITGRWVGKIGVIALIVGVAFFLKYAFDNNWIDETMRVIMGIVLGVALVSAGQYIKDKYLKYSGLLMGAGISILYLSIYSAFAFYSLISAPVAFFIMFVVTVLSVVLSVVNDHIGLAVLGVLGGFLTPVLLGADDPSMITLFSYLLILNIGILTVSVFRKWIQLNYLGFLGTVILAGSWLLTYYEPSKIWQTLAFMFAFFLVFLLSSVIHNIYNRQKSETGDLALIFFNAFGFSITSYYLLFWEHENMLGFFAVLMAVLYFVLAYWADKYNSSDKKLNVFILSTGLVFLTLAIPLQLTGYWITLAWLTQSLAFYYVAFVLGRNKVLEVFGAIVFTVGLVRLFAFDVFGIETVTVLLNLRSFLFVSAIFVAYAIAYIYFKNRDKIKLEEFKSVVAIFIVVANVLTVTALTYEVSNLYQGRMTNLDSSYQSERDRYIQRGESVPASLTQDTREIRRSLDNQKSTAISIVWAIYATILIVLGFYKSIRIARVMGVILIFLTAGNIFLLMWALGPLYRIIVTISFGVIALLISFLYAKYNSKIQEIL